MLRKSIYLFVACGVALLLAGCGQSEQADPALAGQPPAVQDAHRDFGDYRVHFNALSTDNLAPEVARAYGIVRSKNRAMLNVTVMQRRGGNQAPIRARVSVAASNLTGQLKNLRMREITEGEGEGQAVYYIGETAVADGETLIFEISVTPEGEPSSYQLRYQKQFFTG